MNNSTSSSFHFHRTNYIANFFVVIRPSVCTTRISKIVPPLLDSSMSSIRAHRSITRPEMVPTLETKLKLFSLDPPDPMGATTTYREPWDPPEMVSLLVM